MNQYVSLFSFLLFAGILGAVGLLAAHVERLKKEAEDKARRESLEKH